MEITGHESGPICARNFMMTMDIKLKAFRLAYIRRSSVLIVNILKSYGHYPMDIYKCEDRPPFVTSSEDSV